MISHVRKLSHKLPKNVEDILVEITIRKTKWLILGGYNPIKDNISYYLSQISKEIDQLLGNYENILMLGDFNSTVSEIDMKDFYEIYNLHNLIKEQTCYKNAKHLPSIDVMLTVKELTCYKNVQNPPSIDVMLTVKEPTCYKNVQNPSSIDVMLTNRKGSFQNSMVVETGLSDHHKMTVTVLKT